MAQISIMQLKYDFRGIFRGVLCFKNLIFIEITYYFSKIYRSNGFFIEWCSNTDTIAS